MQRISVIDDSEVNCILAKSILSEEYEVNYCMDSCKAMEFLKQDVPDLILLDIMMPVKDGIQLLKEIRGDKILKDVLVIMVSSLTHDNRVEEAINLGANDSLSKPIGNNDLIGLVYSYLH